MERKLTKSNTDKMICGVCGGMADYFNIDATWLRLGLVLVSLCYGIGVFAYIAAAIIMPKGE